MENTNYIQFLAMRLPQDVNNMDDTIEVISTHYEIIEIKKFPPRQPRKSILDGLKIIQDEATRKKLVRGVLLIGGIFIFLSGVLLIVSFSMSKNIDDIVRNSNELLRHQKQIQEISEQTEIILNATIA
ncbi:Hypothetical predicted protein [Mytilus galloprovincialis]|uniref:Uncharacterized protein n=1 Tax=Mytilus galloprovincialis TaxID=29158 RepID=A0A8B6EJ33_MYTGA|nr:Hypothetical predicted protein [Mytilus galloprovincialis]